MTVEGHDIMPSSLLMYLAKRVTQGVCIKVSSRGDGQVLLSPPDLLKEALPSEEENGHDEHQHGDSPSKGICEVEAIMACSVRSIHCLAGCWSKLGLVCSLKS